MQILFHKVSNQRHRLEIIRERGAREAINCETRSYLQHDLLHYAVEAEAGLATGFWGNLANGRTLVELNDRSGRTAAVGAPELLIVERVVGALSSVLKGRAPAELVAGLREEAIASGAICPAWLTVDFVTAVEERMRRLTGRWRSTAFGAAMELEWP